MNADQTVQRLRDPSDELIARCLVVMDETLPGWCPVGVHGDAAGMDAIRAVLAVAVQAAASFGEGKR